MRRREFIAIVGGAAGWPLAARAQQQTDKPVIGFLDGRLPEVITNRLRGFHRGLRDAGYVEGENVIVLYRYAENQSDRLPALAEELARHPVAAIVASGGPNVMFAAKQASTIVPIVFISGEDPVRAGLVASLAHPGGNLTGINFFNRELAGKQLEFLRELIPSAKRIAVLVNPTDARVTEGILKDVESAARAKGLQIQVVQASTSREIDEVFAAFARERPDAVFVPADPFFAGRRLQLSLLAMRHALPAVYSGREFAEVGGLITYGSDITDAYRRAGVYVGRILKGGKPEDMPVVQADKLELIVNVQSARALGLTVPQSLLIAADDVIE
jgi:putative tryptophan/tyrosine transport system substrate-binding protein